MNGMNMTAHEGHGGMGMEHMGGEEELSASMLSFTCEGQPWNGTGHDRPGSWAGHVLAGIALLTWATHWTWATFRAWLTQSKQHPFRSRSSWPVPCQPNSWGGSVEGALKSTVAFLAILTQLWWAHGSWRSNICPSDTPRAGHFWPEHIYSYMNAWVLFTFMVSGIVDVLATQLDLPAHVDAFFTAAAFALNAMLLATAPRMDMLDDMLYYMLFLCTAGTAVFALLEAAFPQAFFASCGKAYCTAMQGIWYLAVARFLYGGHAAWNTTDPLPDMAPTMFSPVPFVFWMNMASLAMFSAFILMRWWYDAGNNEYLMQLSAAERSLFEGEDAHTAGRQESVYVPGGLMSLLGGHHGHGSKASHPKGEGDHELTPLVGKS